MTRYCLSLDLGQVNDYTAAAVLERLPDPDAPVFPDPGRDLLPLEELDRRRAAERTLRNPRPVLAVPHLLRFPLGTPYPEIITETVSLLAAPPLAGQTTLVLDATGCGRPVFDSFRAAGLAPVGIVIHGGDQVTADPGAGWRVPKRDLAGCLQVLLQNERLRVAKALPLAAVLVKELLDFRVKVSLAGHDSYEAVREGAHDDLVLSVACGAWWHCRGCLRNQIRRPTGLARERFRLV